MVCKGICIRHKAQKPVNSSPGRYATGQRRCQICEIFMNWDGLWCPCCGVGCNFWNYLFKCECMKNKCQDPFPFLFNNHHYN